MTNTSEQKTAGKMICPRCGAEMNHHADKVVHGGGPPGLTEADRDDVESQSDELTMQFHSCPNCGAAASRNA